MPLDVNGTDAKALIARLFAVVDKETRANIPFIFNNVQDLYYLLMTLRDVILKARQQGFSTLILAFWFLCCMCIKNTAAVVISHEQKATERLFNRVKYFKDHMKYQPYTKTESKTELSFPKTNSFFYVGTAGSRAFGHGDTITLMHASEFSRWKNPDLLTGILEAIPQSGRAVIETTANGFGDDFHRLWTRAQEHAGAFGGDAGWTPHFYGWNKLNSNRRAVPANFKPTPVEKELKVRFNLELSQLAWRRWKISTMEKPELFQQQHPITELEAFIASGTNMFEPLILQQWYELKKPFIQGTIEEVSGSIRCNEYAGGYMKFYDVELTSSAGLIKKAPGSQYAIGVDVMEGIELEGLSSKELAALSAAHDWNVAVVKDKQTWESIAIYRSQEDPDLFAEKVELLGKYYNNAEIAVEENTGQVALYILQKHRYPNLWYELDVETNTYNKHPGFRTTPKSKTLIIGLLAGAIRSNDCKVWDHTTIRELLAFRRTPEGKMQAPAGMNDDTVIAEAIATMVCEQRPVIKNEAALDNAQFGGKRRND